MSRPTGYGLRIRELDRDRNFDREWSQVTVELEGGPVVDVELSDSFWKSCSELRSAEIGRWLLDEGVAPWRPGNPPGVALRQVEGTHFTARILRSRSLI